MMLRYKIRSLCVKRGTFKLKSGAISDVYLDLRILTLSKDVWYLAQALHIALEDTNYDAIGGPESGANQIVGAFQCFNQRLPPKRGFTVRKADKGYGTGGLIVGSLEKGDLVVLVEDVTTTGESVMRAVEEVEAAGARVGKIISVVDREMGAGELFWNKGILFQPLFKMSELIS